MAASTPFDDGIALTLMCRRSLTKINGTLTRGRRADNGKTTVKFRNRTFNPYEIVLLINYAVMVNGKALYR